MATNDELRLALGDPDWRDDLKKVESAMLAEPARPLVLDATGCRGVGTLAMQLIIAARRHAEAERRPFRIENATEGLRAEAALTGLSDALFGESA